MNNCTEWFVLVYVVSWNNSVSTSLNLSKKLKTEKVILAEHILVALLL